MFTIMIAVGIKEYSKTIKMVLTPKHITWAAWKGKLKENCIKEALQHISGYLMCMWPQSNMTNQALTDFHKSGQILYNRKGNLYKNWSKTNYCTKTLNEFYSAFQNIL